MMREARRVRLLALSALLVGVLSGCEGQPENTPTTAAVTAGPEAEIELGTAAIDLATNSGTYPDRNYVVELADERATQRCVRAAGLTWSGFVYQPPPGSDEDRALNIEGRRRDGYGLADAGRGSLGEPPGGSGGARLEEALFGRSRKVAQLRVPGAGEVGYPVEGCTARAHAAVFGDVTTWARVTFLPSGINMMLAKKAAADPRLQAPLREWSRCMAEHGHQYNNPKEIRYQLISQKANREREIAVAIQDADCNRAAGLARTELELRRAAARALPADQRAELAGLATALDEGVRRARAIVGDPQADPAPPLADDRARSPR
ncbi:hypothetical protein MRQ36_27720 [Micromonospora sp. R77]|uniref:hypothetical protein n=1 Tax=Micromonospora sp. R77 TaxID=2925836 RepID=UPI001F6074A2|nr:hypothetical protein [Micromonospora sp. R77]MCI4066131.1 hypothetical protein [Micromonospora sp. R77]